MAEPILTPWVLSLSVVYVLYIQWIGHFLLKNRSQCNYPLAFRLWTYSTVNYLMKLHAFDCSFCHKRTAPSVSGTYVLRAVKCMRRMVAKWHHRKTAVVVLDAHKREWRHTACLSIYYYVCGMTSLALMRIQYCRFSVMSLRYHAAHAFHCS